MVQVRFLSGKQSGLTAALDRFPATLGRSASADIQIEEDGVWDQHLEVSLDMRHGFQLKTFPNCLASVGGKRFENIALRNGDIIEIGLLRIQFSLRETRQRSLRVREIITWAALAIVSLWQIGLIYWLLTA